ncbi:MAG TPA: single-stranded DNA-binding protein [Candidatus Limnocylindrales bacterium]|nr:single-stranded DNA-binding protein [Candidatus Limnocylindrales bacterium]
MASLNKVMILGNLGQDPELRHTSGGKAVTTLRLATNESWQDANGQRQERTEWHSVVVWGRAAENCKQYLSKGRTVFVEGRLQTRKWQDQSGSDRYTTEIVADRVQFIGGGPGGDRADRADRGDRGGMGAGMDDMGPAHNDDDIPF